VEAAEEGDKAKIAASTSFTTAPDLTGGGVAMRKNFAANSAEAAAVVVV
jgi:hypothetical protein